VSSRGSAQRKYQVICVCGGHGFPSGTASAARIMMVGKALQEAGIAFHLIHCGPSPVSINTQRSGVSEGITFEYTTCVRRPKNKLARLLVYIWAVVGLTARLVRMCGVRQDTIVYSYVMIGPMNLYVGLICRILGLPMVQELCEWWPGEPTCSAFTRWLYKRPIFRLATGALVISTEIEERVRPRCLDVNPDLLIHRVPALVDTQLFGAASPIIDRSDQSIPNFIYCGTWLKDVLFLIRAFALVRLGGYPCKLTIVGFEQRGPTLDYAIERGLSSEDIVIKCCVDRRILAAYYKTATALLLPLWDDDRSITRFPNKICEYLASGRPVVSCRIGDLTNFLTDKVNAYLGKPGDERDFADNLIAVLEDPNRAEQIGAAGQEVCLAHLDYRAHASGLAKFFVHCIESREERRSARKDASRMGRVQTILRNAFCGLLAIGLIASGRVRRARRWALGEDVVTAIYFHKPNRRLFERCIRWLTKYGYTFISANELLEILHAGKAPPRGAVWLSFDDGCKELLENVLPLIRQHKIPVTLFILSGIVEGDGLFPWLHGKTSTKMCDRSASARNSGRDSMTLAEMRQVASCPEVTIGSHTVSHAVTINLNGDKARFEFGESKRTLESWIRADVKCFAYPEGRFDGREREFLAEFDYGLAATTENNFITRETNPYLVPRFSVADEISFPEAICNMVGVWRPMIDPPISFLQRLKNWDGKKTKLEAEPRLRTPPRGDLAEVHGSASVDLRCRERWNEVTETTTVFPTPRSHRICSNKTDHRLSSHDKCSKQI
jgi:glycosyltransferase involved in cell wall biosynthesis/peptidoglycan/xylan/chitin deacetylase (PgdA/CDA1 family)